MPPLPGTVVYPNYMDEDGVYMDEGGVYISTPLKDCFCPHCKTNKCASNGGEYGELICCVTGLEIRYWITNPNPPQHPAEAESTFKELE